MNSPAKKKKKKNKKKTKRATRGRPAGKGGNMPRMLNIASACRRRTAPTIAAIAGSSLPRSQETTGEMRSGSRVSRKAKGGESRLLQTKPRRDQRATALEMEHRPRVSRALQGSLDRGQSPAQVRRDVRGLSAHADGAGGPLRHVQTLLRRGAARRPLPQDRQGAAAPLPRLQCRLRLLRRGCQCLAHRRRLFR
jgi:hypothetical protein